MNKGVLIVLVFLTAFNGVAFAQTKSDTLIQTIEASSDWDEKAEMTYEFCKLNLGSNPNECMRLYDLVEEHELQLTDSSQLFNLYNVKGIIYQYRHDIDSSNIYLNKAFDVASELQDSTLLIKSISNLSTNYRNKGEYKKAIDYSLISVKYNKSHNDTINWANSLSDIGNSYHYLKNYEEAMKHQKEALELFSAKNYWRGIGNSSHSISVTFQDLGSLDSTIYYLNQSIEAHEKSGNVFALASNKRTLCIYYRNEESDKSEQEIYDCHKEALAYDTQIGDKQGMMLDYLNMSHCLNNLKKFKEAIPLNLKALKISKELDDKRVRFKCYESLAIKHHNIDRHKEAYQFLDSARVLEEQLNNIDVQNAVLEADKKFQVVEKEKELIETKKAKAEADLELSEKSNQIWLLIGGTLFLLLASVFLFYRYKQKQRSKLDQVRIEEQQKGLSAVIQTQEDERKRIAKDLHDGIVQQLGGIQLGLQKIFKGKETNETNKIVNLLDESTQELRELSHKMMPRVLGELGLIPALDDMLDNSLGHTSIEHQFEHFGITDRFSENIEVAIFRISQELVNNVIKHSKATKVNVQLFKTGSDVLLIVEDNGDGIKTSKKEGIGLMNISSRLDTINGKVKFEPSPGSGTLATVKIPV